MSQEKRDTSRDGFKNKCETFLLTHFGFFWRTVQRIRPLERLINKKLINSAINKIPPRPYPFSMMYPFTSWDSLTDRTWTGRHLPEDPEFNRPGNLPPLDFSGMPTAREMSDPSKTEVVAEKLGNAFQQNPPSSLFLHSKGVQKSEKSTLLFPYWVQWFTDGFLRTDHGELSNRMKNTSNHHIDLCPVYGLQRDSTDLLRSMKDGKLKSQMLENEDGVAEEYPEFLYSEESGYQQFKPEFEGLYVPLKRVRESVPAERKARFFAMGVERANVHYGYVMFNVLCLREHNRICDLLKENYYSDWRKEGERITKECHIEGKYKFNPSDADAEQKIQNWMQAQPEWRKDAERYVDERIFQTARNILMIIIMKIVVEEYINHIAPYHFKFRVDPGAFAKEKWYRQNWMTLEFSMVYRWHSALPPELVYQGKPRPMWATLFDNDLLIKRGLASVFEEASYQPATRIGLFNTPSFLVPIDLMGVALGRQAKLQSYNDYRELCGFPRVTDFNQITSDKDAQAKLRELYGHVDNIELFVGLYAEDVRENSALPALIGRLVGIDAFSQAFTNPLLAKGIFNAQTYTPVGLKIITTTNTVSDLLHRNVPQQDRKYHVSFYRYKTARRWFGRRMFEAIKEWVLIRLLVRFQLSAMKKQGPGKRGQHPKHQGAVWGEFQIAENLPETLKVGVFEEAKSFPTVIRFSNGSSPDDTEDDVHGMAIKLLQVEGKKLLQDEHMADTQDFILADHPVFMARNLVHLLRFGKTVRDVKRGFEKPDRLEQVCPAYKGFKKCAKHSPLAACYWSQTPYRLGSHIVRYHLRPIDAEEADDQNCSSRDFLREAMVRQLTDENKEARFEFCIQLAPDENEKWIEDPTQVWDEKLSPFIPVATIVIPPQKFDTPDQRQFCENLSYTPWHSLPEHEPVGQINRARRHVYQASSVRRHQFNGVARQEPTLADRPGQS